ncbi:MAG: MATE family efflux transporter [Treponema sp.]|jgi:putative MATE family efflux protein|nr:MATE family efflux transporter [Treponema sp.]
MSVPANEKSDKYIKMTTSPVEKLVLNLAGPSIVIMLTSSIYNITDTFFVSSLGTSQVAAVGIAFPLMAVIQAMGFFFGQGSGNYMARALGAKDTEGASRMAATGLISGFIVMAVIATAGLIALGPLVEALGTTETIKPFAMDYILFVLIASPWMVAATVLNQQLRFQGNAAFAMAGMLSGAVLNIFLDPLFIFVFNLGVQGAAIATLISQMTSFFILFFYASARKDTIPVKFKYFSPSAGRFSEMFKGGVPALIRQSLMSIASIIINHFARPYGDAAIAAISIANRISMFSLSILLGFGQGFQPVCGFNYGAKLYGRVKKAFWFCVRFCCIGLFIVAILMAVFAPNIIALFRKDDLEVIIIGALGLRLQCISLPFIGGIILVNMMTQTMGKALEASIIALSRQGLFLIPSLFILGPVLGLTGIQLARPVSELASLVIVIPVLIRTLRLLSDPELSVDSK